MSAATPSSSRIEPRGSSRDGCRWSTTTSTASSPPGRGAGRGGGTDQASGHRPQRTAGGGRLGRRHAEPGTASRDVIRGDPAAADAGSPARRPGRETEEQVIAANVDTVLIVFGLDTPREAAGHRALSRRWRGAAGAQPVIVLNKSDLAEDARGGRGRGRRRWPATRRCTPSARATGPCVAALAPYLAPGRTMALLGPSGAGKSSHRQSARRRARLLATGEVREWDARGRHTSVHRQMLVPPGGRPHHRHARHARAAAVGRRRQPSTKRSRTSWRSRRAAGSATAVTTREPGCAVKARGRGRRDSPADRYESYLKLAGRAGSAREAARRARAARRQAPGARRQQGAEGHAERPRATEAGSRLLRRDERPRFTDCRPERLPARASTSIACEPRRRAMQPMTTPCRFGSTAPQRRSATSRRWPARRSRCGRASCSACSVRTAPARRR